MEGEVPANQDVIQHNGELFASADYLAQILGSSSGSSSQLVKLYEGRPFLSVIRINDLLASFTTEQLEIVDRPAEAGQEKLALRLMDGAGEEVPSLDALRQEEWALHSSISSEDEQHHPDDDQESAFARNFDVVRHDTPIDGGDPREQPDQRRKDSCPPMQHRNEDIDRSDESSNMFVSSPYAQDFAGDVDGFGEASDMFVSSPVLPDLPPQNLHDEPPSSEDEPDDPRIALTHRSRQYDEAVVRKLRGLKILDLTTLNRLLENRSPLAVSPLSKTRDELVHLCTLENGSVFVIKMFKDLHAHNEKLDLANLNDPALLDEPLTGYQRNELSIILRDIRQTPSAQQFWSSAHLVPRTRRHDYCRVVPQSPDIIKRNVFYKYDTMADFQREVDSLVKNVERFHGSVHEVTAAAKRTVREISARMDEAAAVGICDNKERLFHGLVREVALSEGTLLALANSPLGRMPRFVLPLGTLYIVQYPAGPPRFCSAIILMDVSNPRKAIWLYHTGEESSYVIMLAADIAQWKLSSGPGANDGGLMKRGPAGMRRTKLTKEYRESRIDLPPGAVVFKRAPKTQLAMAIKEGWGWRASREELVVTPRKRPGGAVATPRNKRVVYVWDSDGAEEWVPFTEHRKSKKTVITPKGQPRREKPPRTI